MVSQPYHKKIRVNLCASVLTLLGAFCLPHPAASQPLIEKKIDNGPDSARFVMVILAEGYTDAQQGQFMHDVDRLITKLFAESPWKEYQKAVNVYSLFTPSVEAGADHPVEGNYVDTAFDATFGTAGISRLLTVNEAAVLRAAAQIAEFDTVIVLVNDPQYGGSGGSVIVASAHDASDEIVLHELGHVVARLADEYTTAYPGYPPGASEPNVTVETRREKIKWNNWIEPTTPLPTPEVYPESIGLFEGARYQRNGIYRPCYTCRMRSLGQPYCPICAEALVLNIYNYAGLFDAFYPADTVIELREQTPLRLGIEQAALSTNQHYEITWDLDGTVWEDATQPELVLSPSQIQKGRHRISVHLRDTTELVKNDPQGLLTSHQSWEVVKSFCSGRLSGTVTDGRTNAKLRQIPITLLPGGAIITSDDSGKFSCQDIGCGLYTIQIHAVGYAPFSRQISVVDAQTTTLPLVLQPASDAFYITGTVVGLVPQCTITASGTHTAQTTTDETGRFTLGPLPSGEYRLVPAAPEYGFFPSQRILTLKDHDITQIRFAAIRQSPATKKK